MRSLALVLALALIAPACAATPQSGLSRALTAAFQELLQEGDGYQRLHSRYTGIPPRVVPATAPVAWPARVDGSPLDRVLFTRVLRLGWRENLPYQFRDAEGRQTGIDHDLAGELAARIGRHYSVPDLQVAWVEVAAELRPGEEQTDMYRALIAALKRNDFDAGMSGLLVLPGQPVASAGATSVLFTNVFYTGRGGLSLKGADDRAALIRYLATQPQEFSFQSVTNRGPSGAAANALAEAVRQAGGRAVSHHGTIREVVKALYDGSVHFIVGDSVSLGYLANQPGFAGQNLNIPAADRSLDLAPFTLPGGYGTSELSTVVSAAFREFAADPGRYTALYEKYLGVRREPPADDMIARWISPAEVTPGSTLDRVLQSGRLRIGFWRHPPYYYTEDGRDAGFELELGNAIGEILAKRYPGLQVEWVEQSFPGGGGGKQNMALFDSLEPGLLAGRFDLLMTGLIVKPDRPVAVAAPTMQIFMTAIYTGKDQWDLRALQSTGREHFVRFLVEHPGCTILSTPGGPSEETARQVVAEVAAAGGSASNQTSDIPELIQALRNGSYHFVIGDGIALSHLAARPGFPGLNLNLSLRQPEESIAPMTALDP